MSISNYFWDTFQTIQSGDVSSLLFFTKCKETPVILSCHDRGKGRGEEYGTSSPGPPILAPRRGPGEGRDTRGQLLTQLLSLSPSLNPHRPYRFLTRTHIFTSPKCSLWVRVSYPGKTKVTHRIPILYRRPSVKLKGSFEPVQRETGDFSSV